MRAHPPGQRRGRRVAITSIAKQCLGYPCFKLFSPAFDSTFGANRPSQAPGTDACQHAILLRHFLLFSEWARERPGTMTTNPLQLAIVIPCLNEAAGLEAEISLRPQSPRMTSEIRLVRTPIRIDWYTWDALASTIAEQRTDGNDKAARKDG